MHVFSLVLSVGFIGCLKVLITAGLDADIATYFSVLSNLKVVEVLLWISLVVMGRDLVLASNIYNASHHLSHSSRISKNPDGSTTETVTSCLAQSSDFERVARRYKVTILGFVAAVFGMAAFYGLG